MTTIDLSKAKAELSKYARLAEHGETVLVRRRHKPSFIIAPAPATQTGNTKRLGLLKNKIRIAEDFDQTPDEISKAFYGD